MNIFNNRIVFFILSIIISIAACEKDDDDDKASYVPRTPEQDDAQILAYITDSLGINESEIIELDSGNYIVHIEEGIDDKIAIDSTNIEVHYTGYSIPSGDLFDNSGSSPSNPRLFNLANNIAGWRVALKEMKRAGKAHIFIPSHQAYGNGNRHFTVQLVGFTDISENRDNYENSLIQDYFTTNEITDAVQVADTANVYIQHTIEGTGTPVALKDSVEMTFDGYNIVTEIAKHDNLEGTDQKKFLVDEMRDGFKLALPYMKEGGEAYIYVPSKRNATHVDVLRYKVNISKVIVN